jgi:hypothetical protein
MMLFSHRVTRDTITFFSIPKQEGVKYDDCEKDKYHKHIADLLITNMAASNNFHQA